MVISSSTVQAQTAIPRLRISSISEGVKVACQIESVFAPTSSTWDTRRRARTREGVVGNSPMSKEDGKCGASRLTRSTVCGLNDCTTTCSSICASAIACTTRSAIKSDFISSSIGARLRARSNTSGSIGTRSPSPASACRISSSPISRTIPSQSVVRSKLGSCNTISWPSPVTRTSISNISTPISSAFSKAASVFSGAKPRPEAPLWAMRRGGITVYAPNLSKRCACARTYDISAEEGITPRLPS